MNFNPLNNPLVQNVKNFGKSKSTGQWANFLKQTEEEKKQSGYLVFKNIDDITDIDGFRFDVLETEDVKFVTKYTDHFLESGRTAADASIKSPVILTLKGKIGDVFVEARPHRKILNTVLGAFGIATSYLPTKTQTQTNKAMQIQAQLEKQWSKVVGAVNVGQTLVSAFKNIFPGGKNITRTQTISQYLAFAYHNSILLNLYTRTAGNLENIVITNLNFIRVNEASNTVDVSLECKQLYFAETQVITINKKSFIGSVQAQVGDYTKQTKTQGKEVGKPSILFSGGRALLDKLF
jgi:hypothetical protein